MSYTAKYKQTARQVRLQTQESNFSKGMFYSNKPLAEGYNKVVANYDIGELDGKLHTRTGIVSEGVFIPKNNIERQQLDCKYGYNNIITSKICDHTFTNAFGQNLATSALHTIVYNTFDESLYVIAMPTEFTKDELLNQVLQNKENPVTHSYAESDLIQAQPISNGRRKEITEGVYNIPYEDRYKIAMNIVEKPKIHGQYCMHNAFFQKPIGCFAFGDTYYSFCNEEYLTRYDDTHRFGIEKIYGRTIPSTDEYRMYYDATNQALVLTKYDTGVGRYVQVLDSFGLQLSYKNAGSNTLYPVGTTGRVSVLNTFLGSFTVDPTTQNPVIVTATSINTLVAMYLYFVKGYRNFEDIVAHFGESVLINVSEMTTGTAALGPIISGSVARISGETDTEYKNRLKFRNNFRIIANILPAISGDSFVVQQILLGDDYPNNPSDAEKDLSTTFIPSLHYTKFFNTTETANEQVVHALEEHDTSETSVGNLIDSVIIPRELTPSEAAKWGVNMLSQTPYRFVCNSGAVPIITGVLAYDATNTISLSPILNQPLILKCFYNAPINKHQYRIEWAWREVGSSDWIKLKGNEGTDGLFNFEEDMFQNSALQPFTCNFTGAAENIIIKVTIYDVEDAYDKNSGRDIIFTDLSTPPDPVSTAILYKHTGETTTSFKNGSYYKYTGTEFIEYTDILDIIERVAVTNSLGLSFIKAENAEKNTAKPIQYILSTAKGILEWKNRLVLWGVRDAETILWTSEVNDPSYFPYPGNIDIMNERIIHCMPYGDDLIVFTSTNLYRLSLNADGLSWTKTHVQRNLNISETDISTFCVVKNMLFFKSGNYYYMLVPKSTVIAGETSIAPVARPIEFLLDNWNTEILEILNKVTQCKTCPMNEEDSLLTDYLINYYSYVDSESVVINYVYDYASFLVGHPNMTEDYTHDALGWNINLTEVHKEVDGSRYLVVSLVYDTSAYTWRLRIYHTPKILTPTHTNALSQTIFTCPVSLDEVPVAGINYQPYGIQRITKCGNSDRIIQYISTEMGALAPTAQDIYNTRPIPNNQFLDTGYRQLNDGSNKTDFKKRFREFQFTLTNVSRRALHFFTAFILDGQVRKDMQGYETQIITDPLTPGVGTIVVIRPFIDEYVSPGETSLDDEFILDNTQFPMLDYWKCRISVSGKGYLPRMQLLSVSEEEYDLNSIDWVYRTMNSR